MPDANVSPLLGGMVSTITKSGKSGIHGPQQVDRALGAVASFGLSLAILRFVVSAYKAVKRFDGGENNQNKVTSGTGEAMSSSFYNYIRRVLRRFLLDGENDSSDEQDYRTGDGAIITHQGSCHCESVQFELLAPRCLAAVDGPGKIQYRHTQILTTNFRIMRGKECMKTYYVASRRQSARGAHAFCQRCGVHILYAPCKNSPTVNINVNCISEGIRKVRMIGNLETISDGLPLDEQWDDSLSVISGVTGKSYGLISRLQTAESTISNESFNEWKAQSDWKGYTQYDERNGSSYVTQKLARVPGSPATPLTVDSLTADESQISALRVPNIEQDSIATSEIESDDSSTQGQQNFIQSSTPRSSVSTPRSAADSPTTTAAPAQLNQMKYFMKKHLSSSPTREEEKKSTESSSSTREKEKKSTESSSSTREEEKKSTQWMTLQQQQPLVLN